MNHNHHKKSVAHFINPGKQHLAISNKFTFTKQY